MDTDAIGGGGSGVGQPGPHAQAGAAQEAPAPAAQAIPDPAPRLARLARLVAEIRLVDPELATLCDRELRRRIGQRHAIDTHYPLRADGSAWDD